MSSESICIKKWERKYGNSRKGHISRKVSERLYENIKHSLHLKKDYPIVLDKIYHKKTSKGPKHILKKENRLYVSCIYGQCLDVFNLNKGCIEYDESLCFKFPCIQAEIVDGQLYVTHTNFNKRSFIEDRVSSTNLFNMKTQYIRSGGKWSKFIIKVPNQSFLLISNWMTNNLSVLSIVNPETPKIQNKVRCGISPRGIAFSPEGDMALVACYYSRNIIELKVQNGNLSITNIGEPFDYPNYSGNMRDVVIDGLGNYAFISNMGRDLVHKYNIKERTITDSVQVGCFPNSLILKKDILLVSCHKSNKIFVLDTKNMNIIGTSEETREKPVGMCYLENNILATTSFRENVIELWKLNKQKIKTKS